MTHDSIVGGEAAHPMTVDANRVSDERLRALLDAEIPLEMSVGDARSIIEELQSLRRSPSLSGGEVVAWRVRERPGFDWRFIDGDPDRDPSLNGYEKQPLYASPAPLEGVTDMLELIKEEASKDNAPFGRSDSLALGRIRTALGLDPNSGADLSAIVGSTK